MASTIKTNNITGFSGGAGPAPITLSGDTAILGSGVTNNAGVASGTIGTGVTGGLSLTSDLDSSATNGPTSGTAVTKSTTLPIFACRAWVSFNGGSVDGSNNCAINASGNISKVVRFGTGQFDVYFETAMPDTNYVMVGSGFYGSGAGTYMGIVGIYNNTNFTDSVFTTYIKIAQTGHNGTNINGEGTTIAFFR